MKFHLARSGGRNLFTGYGRDYVEINETRHERSLAVAPERFIDWGGQGFDALRPEDFAALLDLAPEIVVFGTGGRLRFPAPALTAPLAAARVGFEVMDTGAACRTYNILMTEGRRVVAAVLL